MKIAFWNINSIRARSERAVDVLKRHDIDVLLLQETKCKPEQFPTHVFEELGYRVACAGLNQWNGVAILSRVGLEEVQTAFPGQPAFAKKGEPIIEARAISALCNGVRVWSVYVPNGRAIDDPHYAYKIEFLHQLRAFAQNELAEKPHEKFLIAGDWNVAPTDEDVWDISAFADGLYVSQAEREAFYAFEKAGLTELSRRAENTPYTYWDYQKLRFPRNEGMRIDFMYASASLEERCTHAFIDRDERRGQGASDHVPVIIDFDM